MPKTSRFVLLTSLEYAVSLLDESFRVMQMCDFDAHLLLTGKSMYICSVVCLLDNSIISNHFAMDVGLRQVSLLSTLPFIFCMESIGRVRIFVGNPKESLVNPLETTKLERSS